MNTQTDTAANASPIKLTEQQEQEFEERKLEDEGQTDSTTPGRAEQDTSEAAE